MRKIIVTTHISLDGVMQAPGAPEEDPTENFHHGGWMVPFFDYMMGETAAEDFSRPMDLLLGRKTYEIFAAHWPYVADDPMADRLNGMTKYVVSNTLDRVTWHGSHLLKGDAAQTVRELKSQDGLDLQVPGSGHLIQTLLQHDLVDELYIWIFPVLLGHGKRLFSEGTAPRELRLVNSKTSTTGVLLTTYQRVGDVRLGSFALEEPSTSEIQRRQSLAG